MAFTLDPRLAGDTLLAGRLGICETLIMNDARYPWVILVPRMDGARELHDLAGADFTAVIAASMTISRAMAAWPNVTKVNIGALGNVVPQLHIHIIGRREGDPAWPGPVWGHSQRVPYDAGEVDDFMAYLQALL